MDIFGTAADDVLEGQQSDDFLLGDAGNDLLVGGDGSDRLIGGNGSVDVGGKDTLEGGSGDDGYLVSQTAGGGSQILDTAGVDAVAILAQNTDLAALNTPESFTNAAVYGDAAIELSSPRSGIVGLEKSGTNLIIDLNRDGVADTNNDLTIINYFNEQGELGAGAIELVNNVNSQDIVALFNDNLQTPNSIAGTEGNDNLNGTDDSDNIIGGAGDDFISGGAGDDLISGAGMGDSFFTVGGKDTLEGGAGNDFYSVPLTAGGGTVIRDEQGDSNSIFIYAENTNFEAINNSDNVDLVSNPDTYGDAAIALSRLQPGIVGLEKSGSDLIIDLNRNGVGDTQSDLTIINYFNQQGGLGAGAPSIINNITQLQVVDLFANDVVNKNAIDTIYRFYNNEAGVHFYTANPVEKETVQALDNFTFEGASYRRVDSLSGTGVPVYRFLNQDTEVHLYTTSRVERDALEELNNYSFEGEAFLAYETQVDNSIPVYRFYNTSTGAHFYTASEVEKDVVTNNLSDFQSEGIAYYALPADGLN